MSKHARRSVLGFAVCLLALTLTSCESSDTIPPADSTLTLSATPAQIVLSGGSQSTPVTLLATVRNRIGVPLPGQDVRFTTTSGVLDPVTGTSVETDDDGNAISVLTAATVGPTITATAGTATATLTLTAASGQLAAILLNSDSTDLNTCSQNFNLIATALDPSGAPIDGVTIFFEFVTSGPDEMTGTFLPTSGVSGSVAGPGEVTSVLDINDTTCSARCIGAGKDCTTTIRARDQGGTILSGDVTLLDQIP